MSDVIYGRIAGALIGLTTGFGTYILTSNFWASAFFAVTVGPFCSIIFVACTEIIEQLKKLNTP